jgi:hypothetical protein
VNLKSVAWLELLPRHLDLQNSPVGHDSKITKQEKCSTDFCRVDYRDSLEQNEDRPDFEDVNQRRCVYRLIVRSILHLLASRTTVEPLQQIRQLKLDINLARMKRLEWKPVSKGTAMGRDHFKIPLFGHAHRELEARLGAIKQRSNAKAVSRMHTL